jgi:transposase
MARQRRYFSEQFKLQVVHEFLSDTATQAQLARRYNLSPHLILQWRKALDAGRLGGEAPGADLQALKAENRELKQLLGQQALELEFLKKVAAYCRQKPNSISSSTTGTPFPSRKDAD